MDAGPALSCSPLNSLTDVNENPVACLATQVMCLIYFYSVDMYVAPHAGVVMCAAATAAASRAAQEEEDLQASASGAVELDEFGRDANMMKRQEAAERRQRRMQRLQQQAARQTSSQVGPCSGSAAGRACVTRFAPDDMQSMRML